MFASSWILADSAANFAWLRREAASWLHTNRCSTGGPCVTRVELDAVACESAPAAPAPIITIAVSEPTVTSETAHLIATCITSTMSHPSSPCPGSPSRPHILGRFSRVLEARLYPATSRRTP